MLAALSASEILLTPPILYIDCQALGGQKAEPLERLWVQADLGERVVPVGQTQVHDHQAEVVGERVGNEEPLARVVLEPDLGFDRLVLVDEGHSAVLYLCVDVEGSNSILAK